METVLITGANRGLGLEFTRQYLDTGARVIAGCRNPEKASDLTALQNDRLTVLKLDVGDEESVQEFARAVKSKTERVDLLINNAGAAIWSPLHQIDPEEMMHVYRVNVIGTLLVTRALADVVAASERRLIINISSLMGSVGLIHNISQGGNYGYAASKAALNMITRQLSFDLADRKITVVAVSPGWVRTDMGGSNADLSPEESIASMRASFESFTLGDSGGFFDRKRSKLDY